METKLPEAPISQTIKVAYKGIDVLLTQRDLNVEAKPFLEKAKIAIDWALANGFEVPVKGFKSAPKEKDFVEGKVCPLDGGKLIKPPLGSRAPIKCENQKYDWTTKVTSGCAYIEWPDKAPLTRPANLPTPEPIRINDEVDEARAKANVDIVDF